MASKAQSLDSRFRRARRYASVASLIFVSATALVPSSATSQSSVPQGACAHCRDFRTGSVSDAYAQRVGTNGEVNAAWIPDSTRLCVGTGLQYQFSACPDTAGGAWIAWVQPGAEGSAVRIQHLSRDGAVTTGWPTDGLRLSTTPGDQYAPVIAADGAGGMFVTWLDFRSGRGRVYAQHATGTDATFAWSDGGFAVSSDSSSAGNSTAVCDSTGGCWIAWQDYRDGVSAVRITHLDAGAEPVSGTPEGGRVACPSTGDQMTPRLVRESANGVLAVWMETRSGEQPGLFAIRLTADGTPEAGWPAAGLRVSSERAGQTLPAVTSDGADGALVAWCDLRTPNGDIYAQRIDAAGTIAVGWPAGGLAVCANASSQYGPAILADAAGGAYVAWEDYRNADQADVYASRITAQGQCDGGWIADGVLVCGAAGEQFSVSLANSGPDGPIATWLDTRSTSSATFTSAGAVRGEPSVRVSFALEGVRPSPAHGAFQIVFSLPDGAPARLELIDVQGRRVLSREVGSLGSGRHVLTLGRPEHVPVGFYKVRLTRGGRTLIATGIMLP